jgi:hypothetical protein
VLKRTSGYLAGLRRQLFAFGFFPALGSAGSLQKVFATLGYPNDEWAMVKLALDDQLAMVASAPNRSKTAS